MTITKQPTVFRVEIEGAQAEFLSMPEALAFVLGLLKPARISRVQIIRFDLDAEEVASILG